MPRKKKVAPPEPVKRVMTAEELTKVANWYASQGYSVIPIDATNLEPLVKVKTYSYLPADILRIKAWWKRWPDALVGIITGKVSNVIMFEAVGAGGAAWVEENKAQMGYTILAKKPDGSVMASYKYPRNIKGLHGRKEIAPNVFMHGNGSWVEAPMPEFVQ